MVPGVSAVIPLKRQTGSGTHSRKQEDFTYQNIPALELRKQAKSLQNPCWIYWGGGANVSLSELLIADCSGRVQVDLLSGIKPSFHSIQVSSQTQTCLYASLSTLTSLTPTRPPHILLFRPSPKAKNIHARLSVTSVSVKCLSTYLSDSLSLFPLVLPFCFPPSACTEADVTHQWGDIPLSIDLMDIEPNSTTPLTDLCISLKALVSHGLTGQRTA